jgi:hypothetical protein
MNNKSEENTFRKGIYERMDLKDTDELLAIWRKADHEDWTEAALDVVKAILMDRLGEIPPEKGATELENEIADTSIPMSMSQLVFSNLPETQNIQALENCVIVEHKNPVREFRLEYEYKELNPKIVIGRDSDAGWTSLGWSILVFLVVFSIIININIPKAFYIPTNRTMVLLLIALALVSFALRLIKHDCVWFEKKDGDFAFIVRLTNRNRMKGEELVRFIKKKIIQTGS